MPVLDASSVAELLAEYGQRAALRGGNPYRARAYGRAAENLMALALPLEDVIATGQLRDIPGVGEAIAAIITTLHLTGTHPSLESMRRETPGSVLEMLGLPGIAPDKIAKIHRQLGIASLVELETAASQGRIAKTKGLGAALERKILQGLEIRRSSQGRRHVHRAAELLAAAAANLKSSDLGLKRITLAGDFRRGCELVSDLSIVAEAPSIRARKVIQSGAQLTVHVAGKGNFGSVLLFATGAESHVQQLQHFAATRGFTLEADGLRRNRRVVAGENEEGIYRALGLPFIAPELREGRGEIEMARWPRWPKPLGAGATPILA
jgi:DNA polymerase (family 10)